MISMHEQEDVQQQKQCYKSQLESVERVENQIKELRQAKKTKLNDYEILRKQIKYLENQQTEKIRFLAKIVEKINQYAQQHLKCMKELDDRITCRIDEGNHATDIIHKNRIVHTWIPDIQYSYQIDWNLIQNQIPKSLKTLVEERKKLKQEGRNRREQEVRRLKIRISLAQIEYREVKNKQKKH